MVLVTNRVRISISRAHERMSQVSVQSSLLRCYSVSVAKKDHGILD